MKTAVRRVLLMSALMSMSPGALYALGLGDIKLNSALNQPFDAEIELVSATQEDLGALRAALASGDTFTRYGLDRPAYLSDFVFRVANIGGKDVLKVTSPKPVTEPFVTLLVEANWPRGRLLREYTVLLDPPVFAPAPAASTPVATPRVSSTSATSSREAEPVAESTNAPAPTPAPRAPRTAVAPTVEPGSSYRVRPNDTLWRIASAAQPGSRSDVNRAMVSIYQNNPQAFEGNINLLRSGSTLQIPDANQLHAVSAAAASAEVARQYDAWRKGATGEAAGATESGRLRLVTPEQGSAAPSTTVGTPPGKAAATPPTSGATPSTAGANTADLQGRVQQLESELAEAKRLLEVKNAELATLQGGTAAAAAPSNTAAAPAGSATPSGQPAGEPAATTATPAATPAAAAAAPKAEPAKPAKPPKVAPAEPQGPSLFDRALQYWWVLLGLVAAALGALLFQRMRRERGNAEENLEEALGGRDLRATPTYTPRSRDSDIVVEEKRAAEPARVVTLPTAAAPRVTEAPKKTVDDTLSGEAAAGTDSGDPLAEADFHMAYGLYDQAADLVQLAIKREPQRRDLKLKLLEIFFVWGNRDRFMELARDLNTSRAEAPAGEWDKVLIMGKQIAPDDPMFAGATSGADSLDMELHGAATHLDLDVTGAPDMDLGDDLSHSATGGIDFVLDEPVRGADGTSPTIESPAMRGAVDSATGPTVETPRVNMGSDTQEVTVDRLGLDVDALRELEALDAEAGAGGESQARVEDTVETTAVTRKGGRSDLEDEVDLLSNTGIMSLADSTAILKADDVSEEGVVDLSEATGELPAAEGDLASQTGILKAPVDFDIAGEPATMSEVGTKLDLARAYIDMGDPEGARSILDEVLKEGNPNQRKEAERLLAGLP
jgi:pilus assembly protein FimV